MTLQITFLKFGLHSWLFNLFTKLHITLHYDSSYSNIGTWNFTYNIIKNNITFYTCIHIIQNRVETTWHPNKAQHYDAWVWEKSSSITSTCFFSITYWCQAWYYGMMSLDYPMVCGRKKTLASMESTYNVLELGWSSLSSMSSIVLT